MTIKKLLLLIQIIKIKIKILIFRQKITEPTGKNPKHIVLHHDAGGWSFEQVNAYHKQKWQFKSSLGYYAGYHYYIEKDGQVKQARYDTEEAAHTVQAGNPGYWNKNSIGVALSGNFEYDSITNAQENALNTLLMRLMGKYGIDKKEIYPHGKINPTLCPGKNLNKWLEDYKGRS